MSNGLLPGVPDLRSRVMRGLVWVGASQAGGVVTRAVVAIFIARLLTPDEYGLAALALVFASLVMVFSDLALGAALIQRKTLSAVDKDTAFWTTMGAGVIFTVLGAALSGPIASLYGQPEAQPLLLVLSLSFLVSALGATQQNLMLREMDFKRVEVLPMIAALFGGFAAVIAAVYGAGAWAIIVQQVVTVIMTTILVWMRSEWRPRFAFSGASLRDLGGFSAYMLGQRILWYVQVNGDRFLIGRFLGTSALGIYAVAYNTMLVPASKLGGPLQRAFSPAFSRIQDEPARIAATWARVARLLAFVTVPALGGLVVVAPDFVPLVLGSHWEEAVPVVQILAWVGIVQAIQVINMDILLARGRSRTMFRLAIVVTSAHMVAFVVGLEWGIIGVSVAYAISTTLFEPLSTFLAARALNVSPMVFFKAISGVFQAAGGMCLAVLALRVALVDAGVGPLARLALCILAGVVVYGLLCLWRVPELRGEARDLLARRAGRSGPLVPATAKS
jgi:O-antigen/teichoic acid export membrane protein